MFKIKWCTVLKIVGPTLFIVLQTIVLLTTDWSAVSPDVQRDIGVQYNGLSLDAELKKIRPLDDGNAQILMQINGPGARELINMIREATSNKRVGKLTEYPQDGNFSIEEPVHIHKQLITKTDYPVTIETPYLINSADICTKVKMIDILVIVHTAMDHRLKRRQIRETWANQNLFKYVTIRVVFFVGESDSKDVNMEVENESVVYGDIVQGMFHDSYRNLTNKGVLTYRWVSEFCTNTKLILKVDDDMFVNIFKVVYDILPKFTKLNRTIGCHLRRKGTSPILRSKSKWSVAESQFRNMTHFPFDYCNGYFVLMTPDLIRPMFAASRISPFFWIDDVYLYGILPSKVGKVQYQRLTKSLSVLSKPGIQCFTKRKDCPLLASGAGPTGALETMWYSKLSNIKNTSTWKEITL